MNHQPKESPSEKLKLGMKKLKKSGKDPDLLGPAMLSIHGALEDQFRHILSHSPTLSETEKLNVQNVRVTNWPTLLELMQQHFALSDDDAKYIKRMNFLRTNAGHGGEFRGSFSEVWDYANFVMRWVPLTDKPRIKTISRLVFFGITMAFCVQFFRANGWQLLLFKSYENAFAVSFFITACGIARTAYIWQNFWVGFGIFITTIGGFSWQYKWVKWTLSFIKIDGIPLTVNGIHLMGIGICIVLYGLFPQLIGWITFIPGILMLVTELWSVFTKGLAAIHTVNLLISIVLIGFSIPMFRRQKSLYERGGAFRRRIM